jgi:hypothetical protein
MPKATATATAPLAPMHPDDVMLAFDFVRAVQAGDIEAAKTSRPPRRTWPRCSWTAPNGSSLRLRCPGARTRASPALVSGSLRYGSRAGTGT